MKVLKFGGTSVGKPENLKTIFRVITDAYQNDNAVTAVFSALSGTTDELINISRLAAGRDRTYEDRIEWLRDRHIQFIKPLFPDEIKPELIETTDRLFAELREIVHGIFLLKELSNRSLDLVMSFGERLSNTIVARYGQLLGLPVNYLDARQFIITDDNFGAARIQMDKTVEKIRNYYHSGSGIQIVTGFIAATEEGITTTLGRGGSDFTTSVIAAAVDAEEVQIWTDVNGVMSADPNKVKEAFSLRELSYEEAMELSHFGAKVLHPPTIQPAMDKNIPVRIMNTFNPEFPGTVIKSNPVGNGGFVKGITSISNISLLTIQGSGMIGVTGISSRLFGSLAKAEVNVILISQASSEHSICVAITPDSVRKAKTAIEREFALEIATHMVDPVIVENDLTILAVVGERMRKTTGLAGRLFNALGEKAINVVAIAQGSSELNISIVIGKKDELMALNAIHDAFFAKQSQINLFVMGVGLIGSTLLKQIKDNYKSLLAEHSLDIKVIGIANSRKMVIDESGIDLDFWKEALDNSITKTDLNQLLAEIRHLNLSNNVLVDCTASAELVDFYEKFLAARTSIVAANKLGNTGSYTQYQNLRRIAKEKNVHFLYETNAGAALPIISTLRDLIDSGDRIIRIEAILSGTISYIFNNFQPGKKFSSIVKEAKEKGYTEPDPRDDLNGQDFARKLLILAREIGIPMELADIHIDPILPENCQKTESVNAFFHELEKSDQHFDSLIDNASAKGKVLRYIANFENSTAAIRLEEIDTTHPFHSLKGSDNIIAFTTSRYSENPLVIKGAGAGAEVTAAGVLADIFKIANSVIKKRSF
ncbi:MAG: bifunctional aspartate kinase/homoserine dehydrogenase I [Candidatus Marinimicrobia bacterium]|nr:bifunctional aspartate kinase/homoserine dehydrogenase I [Candidatus Neomarinimicrobiota bacterium]